VSEYLVTSATTIDATFDIAEDAVIDEITVTVQHAYDDVPATVSFDVLEGLPVATLLPASVAQGSQGVLITATGKYTHWTSETDVEPGTGCGATVTDVTYDTATSLRFYVDLNYGEELGACPFVITTPGSPPEVVDVALQVTSGYTTVAIPSDTANLAIAMPGQQRYHGVYLAKGEVLRARVSADPVLYLDPVLELLDPEGDPTAEPVAYNEDEHAATDDALIVYQAPATGTYFLRVSDRLGIETGLYTLSVAYYEPEDEYEVEPNNNPNYPDTMTGRLLKGDFNSLHYPQEFYDVETTVPGTRLAVQIIAWSVSPYETSAGDVAMWVIDPGWTKYFESLSGAESPDPMVWVDATDLGTIFIWNESAIENTVYWINLRPRVVINEVFHDEVNDWTASFVELYGEPGASLAGCNLLGKVHDGSIESTVFDISLDGSHLLESGYYVVAHDDLVPGAGPPHINPELEIPNGSYVSVAVMVACGGTTLDVLCWRGDDITGCEGTAVDDATTFGNALGRGFFIDTDDNAADFLPQPEPSPWSRNLREVW
jgi:hypothetical protein